MAPFLRDDGNESLIRHCFLIRMQPRQEIYPFILLPGDCVTGVKSARRPGCRLTGRFKRKYRRGRTLSRLVAGRLLLDKRQQVGVQHIRIKRQHAVGKPRIGFQRAVF